tara:strand:- start:68 stop:628 length:561 start_codon:yes stop_codon:yes gene_type:complete
MLNEDLKIKSIKFLCYGLLLIASIHFLNFIISGVLASYDWGFELKHFEFWLIIDSLKCLILYACLKNDHFTNNISKYLYSFYSNLMKIHLVEKNASIKDLFLGILLIFAILVVAEFIPILNILTGLFVLPFIPISLYCFAAIPLKFAKEKGLVKTQSQVYGYLLFAGLFNFIALIYVLIAEEKNHE